MTNVLALLMPLAQTTGSDGDWARFSGTIELETINNKEDPKQTYLLYHVSGGGDLLSIRISRDLAAKETLASNALKSSLNKADTTFAVIAHNFAAKGFAEFIDKGAIAISCIAEPAKRDTKTVLYGLRCVNGDPEARHKNDSGKAVIEISMVVTTPTGSRLDKLIRSSPNEGIALMFPQ